MPVENRDEVLSEGVEGREETWALALSWRPGQPGPPLLPLLQHPTPHPPPPLAAAKLRSGVPAYKGKDETVLEREMHYSAPA